jgi:hypothetical protein
MIQRALKNLLLPVWTTLAFALGILACLTFYEKITPSGWAETTSAIATVVALALAVVTFRNWQHQRIREDAYSTTKTYITTLVEIESAQIEISNLFYSVIPAPGMIALSEEGIQRILNSIQQTHSALMAAALRLVSTKNELPFWGVSLSKRASSEHDTLLEALDRYLCAAHYLHNSLTNIFIYKHEDNSMQSWHSNLNEHANTLVQSFKTRKTLTAKAMFEF